MYNAVCMVFSVYKCHWRHHTQYTHGNVKKTPWGAPGCRFLRLQTPNSVFPTVVDVCVENPAS